MGISIHFLRSLGASRRCALSPQSPHLRIQLIATCLIALTSSLHTCSAYDGTDSTYEATVRPLIAKYCFECHSNAVSEAEINFESMPSIKDVRKHLKAWQRTLEVVETSQMPPKDAKQPNDAERNHLNRWTKEFLTQEANAHAGDPGPVVLRRLNNAEYTYTLRDITGIESLAPAREFPADSAAGEGFTNTGNALVMSPSLVTKYMDAAKEVAAHAVLTPKGIRFSKHTSPSDWTNETLDEIRRFYAMYSDEGGGESVNLQGIIFDTNQGGRLPLERYIRATLAERDALRNKTKTLQAVAQEYRLNTKYLTALWNLLDSAADSTKQTTGSSLIGLIRQRWQQSKPEDAVPLSNEIVQWQRALWRFTSVGHIGKVNGPKSWQESTDPISPRQELRWKLPDNATSDTVTFYLRVGDAGDGNADDFAYIERPRLVAQGRQDILLRDVRAISQAMEQMRPNFVENVVSCLIAADEASRQDAATDIRELANKHRVDEKHLSAWLEFLGIGGGSNLEVTGHLTRQAGSMSGYDFVKGWVGDDALSIVANSSDQHVRIPGNLNPHSVAVHPSPTMAIAIGWQCPEPMVVRVDGSVQHAHPECGNGVAWALELRRGNSRQKLKAGFAQGSTKIAIGAVENISLQRGDLLSLIISPRDGNHSCDLTAVDLNIASAARTWDLAKDISSNLIEGNPHVDSFGTQKVWHFYSEATNDTKSHVIPSGSLLARWQSTVDNSEKQKLAGQIRELFQNGPVAQAADSPDAILYRQLTSFSGPLFAAAAKSGALNSKQSDATQSAPNALASQRNFGMDPTLFGRHPNGSPIEEASLCVKAPTVFEITLPASLAAGAEIIASGFIHQASSKEGSVQFDFLTTKPTAETGIQTSEKQEANLNGLWSDNNRKVVHSTPIVVADNSPARERIKKSFDEFRNWFPIALCYTKIVPVDEVVTLTLFHREDDHLQRLMLTDSERERLEQLWAELHFVSRDAFKLVDAYEQLWQFATQDADPSAFEPLREPIKQRAAAFREQLTAAEPEHIRAAIAFAKKAYRRALTDSEQLQLSDLYKKLRVEEVNHEDAVRLLLTRILVSPDFLYRLEKPNPGTLATRVTANELANRLSYFLWSSAPDQQLLESAQSGELFEKEVLRSHVSRMLSDPRARRFATEFGGQWLHIVDFDQHDEKSERHFPQFAELRSSMYEESIQFVLDLVQNDRSILNLVDADYTFVNESLANFYGIEGVHGPEFRRVDGVRKLSRGGILTQATTLAKQSGASRTSPILRGNWLSEVILGEKLPRPPKNVPQLAESAPDGMTERQLIELHSKEESCMKCHARIDPFGFALENFDAIGQFRRQDTHQLPIDSKTRLPDGTDIHGLEGLKSYLLNNRRSDFVRQFNRKLLGYALGRATQLSDQPLLEELQRLQEQNDYSIHKTIEFIVASKQFQEIRGLDVVIED